MRLDHATAGTHGISLGRGGHDLEGHGILRGVLQHNVLVYRLSDDHFKTHRSYKWHKSEQSTHRGTIVRTIASPTRAGTVSSPRQASKERVTGTHNRIVSISG